MLGPKAAWVAAGVVALVVLIGVGAVFFYVRSPETLTLDRSSTQSLEPWPDGVEVIDSWPGMEGPGGGDIEPEAESMYLLIAGEPADLRGEPLVAAIADHLHTQGWNVRHRLSGSHWATTWGTNQSPGIWFYLGLFDRYLDNGPGRGVERSNDDLTGLHGSDSGLVVLQLTASE